MTIERQLSDSFRLKPPVEHVSHLKEPAFSGPSHVAWTKERWVAVHASFYTPVYELETPLPVTAEMVVHVKSDMGMSLDLILGSFRVIFPGGYTTGIVRTENSARIQSRGFQAVTNGCFWLAATRKGTIRGNIGSNNGGKAQIYLRGAGTTVYQGSIPFAEVHVPQSHLETARQAVRRRRI